MTFRSDTEYDDNCRGEQSFNMNKPIKNHVFKLRFRQRLPKIKYERTNAIVHIGGFEFCQGYFLVLLRERSNIVCKNLKLRIYLSI